MIEWWTETVQAAVLINGAYLLIIVLILAFMYRNVMRQLKSKGGDNSLHLKCDEKLKLKDIALNKLECQKEILMQENVRIMESNEDLAILLSQKRNNP